MKKYIVPSIISKSQIDLNDKINSLSKFAKIIQLDIMDGKFVPTKSLNFNFKIPQDKSEKKVIYEAHLMIKNPKAWLNKNYKKVNTILIHYESCKKSIKEIIKLGKRKNINVGIALNPQTEIEEIEEYLPYINQVLILTVNPGYYGGKFLPLSLKKVSKLHKKFPKLNIEVDGGINNKTIKKADNAGANLFVSGSYIIMAKNKKKYFDNLRKALKRDNT